MIEYRCPACKAALQIPGQYQGTVGKCTHCGAMIQVPKTTPTTAIRQDLVVQHAPHPGRRLWIPVGIVWALLVIQAVIAMIRGADGSALTLAVFSVSFTIGVASLALLVTLFLMSRLPAKINAALPRWAVFLLLALTGGVAFFLAWMTYSP